MIDAGAGAVRWMVDAAISMPIADGIFGAFELHITYVSVRTEYSSTYCTTFFNFGVRSVVTPTGMHSRRHEGTLPFLERSQRIGVRSTAL